MWYANPLVRYQPRYRDLLLVPNRPCVWTWRRMMEQTEEEWE